MTEAFRVPLPSGVVLEVYPESARDQMVPPLGGWSVFDLSGPHVFLSFRSPGDVRRPYQYVWSMSETGSGVVENTEALLAELLAAFQVEELDFPVVREFLSQDFGSLALAVSVVLS